MSRTKKRPVQAPAPELDTEEYVTTLRTEYLDNYISPGGASVKFVAPAADACGVSFSEKISEIAHGREYVAIRLDAADTRMQLIEELFFAISHRVDWCGLAACAVRRSYAEIGIHAEISPDPIAALQIKRVAEANELDAGELYLTIRQSLEKSILGDETMLHQFRVAMLRICQSLLGWGEIDTANRDVVLGWLHGNSVPLPRLRAAGLYTRIARHNARSLFTSFTRWVELTGKPGIVLQLDMSRLGVHRRPPPGSRRGFYYTKAAVLDTFEILRQFVDCTDELRSTLITVIIPRRMINDPQRGLPAYQALHLRVANEVRDLRRANPLATLVRINSSSEESR